MEREEVTLAVEPFEDAAALERFVRPRAGYRAAVTEQADFVVAADPAPPDSTLQPLRFPAPRAARLQRTPPARDGITTSRRPLSSRLRHVQRLF